MRVRRLVLGTVLLLALPTLPARAADAVPAPTVSVRTTWAAGAFPVKGLVKAGWRESVPGRLGTILVSGDSVAGTTTTIDALWTSRDVTVYRDIPALAFKNEQLKHQGMPPGSCVVSYGWRSRTAGGTWSAWHDTTFALPASVDAQAGETRVPGWATRARHQFQWRLHVVVDDTSQVGFNWAVRANS